MNQNDICIWVEDRIEPYLDEVLPPDEATRLRSHINDCPNCRRELRLATRVRTELRSLPSVDAHDGITSKWADGLGERTPEPRSIFVWNRPLFRLAAAAVLVIAVDTHYLGDQVGRGTDTGTEEVALARKQVE
jgi:anti-sigma factor RsiW